MALLHCVYKVLDANSKRSGTMVSNYITDMLQTRFRFRLTDCQLCVDEAIAKYIFDKCVEKMDWYMSIDFINKTQ